MNSRARLESIVLTIHHRNSGCLQTLDWQARLLEPSLRIDSLDLAEIMVAVEKEFGVSPFESGTPRTWGDVLETVEKGERRV